MAFSPTALSAGGRTTAMAASSSIGTSIKVPGMEPIFLPDRMVSL